jgi:hypothetical protein
MLEFAGVESGGATLIDFWNMGIRLLKIRNFACLLTGILIGWFTSLHPLHEREAFSAHGANRVKTELRWFSQAATAVLCNVFGSSGPAPFAKSIAI